MSQGEERAAKQVVVDPNALLAQAQELAQAIENMRGIIASLSARMNSIVKARETIEVIRGAKEPMLIPADPEGIAFYKAMAVNQDKFIVHLGLDVYAALDANAAIEKLKRMEEEVDKEMKMVGARLDEARRQYEALQSILQQIALAVQAQREAEEKQAGKQTK